MRWHTSTSYMQDKSCQHAHIPVIILTCNLSMTTCNIITCKCNIIILACEIIMLPCDLNKLHVNIIIMHVDKIYLACRGQKYAAIVLRDQPLNVVWSQWILHKDTKSIHCDSDCYVVSIWKTVREFVKNKKNRMIRMW